MPSDYLLDKAAFEMWQQESCDNETEVEAFKKIVKKVIQNELNEKQREILYLYYYDRLTMEQIAKQLNVNTSAICRHLKRIRRKLYGFLKYAAELYYGREMTIAEMES